MADEVAKAYIQLVPSAQGIKGSITAQLGGETDEAGAKAGAGFSKAFGGALAGIGKVVTAAVAAGAAAATKIAKDAVEGFADYEQLTGGVETLFKDSADKVKEYAADAYKTAGVSANKYMETVTSFSASLLQSLDGDTSKAADAADQAIRDMADNANKMGTSIESIQNAYQGFAKQNYTMLDNLKLGYGGTRGEMERLLEDATKLSGVEYDIASLNDVYEAIHVVQTELGITGTTAAEASETISGSVGAMKSAWENLLVGMADSNANLDTLINNLIESAETAFNNLMPVIERTVIGAAQIFEKIAPLIADRLPALAEAVLPSLINAAMSLVAGLVAALPQILAALLAALTSTFLHWLESGSAEMQIFKQAIAAVAAAILAYKATMLALTIAENAATIAQLALNAAMLLNPAALIAAAVVALIAVIVILIKNFDVISEKLSNLWGTVKEGAAKLVDTLSGAWDDVRSFFSDILSAALNWGRDLIDNFVQGIKDRVQKVIDEIKALAAKIKEYLGFSEPELGPLSDFHTFAPDMMELFAQGIRQNAGLVTDAIDSSFDIAPRIADYGMSGASTPSFAAAAAAQSPSEGGGWSGDIVIDLTTTLDGQVLSRNQYRYNRDEDGRRGFHAVR